jgi:hypothetical protein
VERHDRFNRHHQQLAARKQADDPVSRHGRASHRRWGGAVNSSPGSGDGDRAVACADAGHGSVRGRAAPANTCRARCAGHAGARTPTRLEA